MPSSRRFLTPRPELQPCALETNPATADVQQGLSVSARDLGPLLCRATLSIRIGQDEISVARLEADEVGASVLPWKVTFDDASLDAPFLPEEPCQ